MTKGKNIFVREQFRLQKSTCRKSHVHVLDQIQWFTRYFVPKKDPKFKLKSKNYSNIDHKVGQNLFFIPDILLLQRGSSSVFELNIPGTGAVRVYSVNSGLF